MNWREVPGSQFFWTLLHNSKIAYLSQTRFPFKFSDRKKFPYLNNSRQRNKLPRQFHGTKIMHLSQCTLLCKKAAKKLSTNFSARAAWMCIWITFPKAKHCIIRSFCACCSFVVFFAKNSFSLIASSSCSRRSRKPLKWRSQNGNEISPPLRLWLKLPHSELLRAHKKLIFNLKRILFSYFRYAFAVLCN